MLLCDCAQILNPDEFDCMLTCEVRAMQIYDASPSKCYAAMKITGAYWRPLELLNSSGDGFICPKAFRGHFRQQIISILKCVTPEHDKELGTLYVHNRNNWVLKILHDIKMMLWSAVFSTS